MDVRIAKSHGFDLFLDRAWGRKYMFIGLQKCIMFLFTHKVD